MRATPVGTWQTNRSAWRGPGRDREEVAVDEGKVEESSLEKAENRGDRGRTKIYSNSYDVGFVFEALWRKRKFDPAGRRVPSHSCPDVRIPDTVIYKSGYPAQWYFQSKQEEGKILKKNTRSLQIPKIFETFGVWNGVCDTQVVACFVGTMGKDPAKQINNIVFFDRAGLKDFLYGENVMKEGFLQRFVAPATIPFDNTATNVTLHVSWSQYKCLIEQRVNKMKLDNPSYKTAEKVNLSSMRVETISISEHSRLHKSINDTCAAIADHIRATTVDNTEITNMTCYFKSGPKNAIFLLFVSSVTVAPKFQDAFGYIHSLHTFTGRHSPDLICPDFFGLVDSTLREAAQHQKQGRCALCDISNEDDKDCRSYAVTYKMLAMYSAADRSEILNDLRYVSIPQLEGVEMSKANRATQIEGPVNVTAKASALFAVLDTLGAGKLPRIELWAGLLDYGYSSEEIALILDVAGPESPADRALDDLKEFAELSDEDVDVDSRLQEEERAYTPDFDDNAGTGEQEESNEQHLNSRDDGVKDRHRSKASLQIKIPHTLHEQSFESQHSTKANSCISATLVHAKDVPAAVRREYMALEDFVKGVEVAFGAMNSERRSRFLRNVDLIGEAGKGSSIRMEPSSPIDAFSGMLDDNKDRDEEAIEHIGGPSKVEVNVEFAREAVDRSRARQLARKLPKCLTNLSKGNALPPSHVKRIIAADGLTEEFGANRIWCCKKCAMKFNHTANEVFDWSDKKKEKSHAIKVQKRMDNLRRLKQESGPRARHSYPVGELPELCTPRMYQALHDHASRTYTVGPPQFTAGGGKDVIAETARVRGKTEFRRTRLPQLDKLPMENAGEAKNDADLSDLMDRLGLTPRRSVKSHFGSQYKPKKGVKGVGLGLAEGKGVSQPGVTRRLVDPNAANAFDWLETSLADF